MTFQNTIDRPRPRPPQPQNRNRILNRHCRLALACTQHSTHCPNAIDDARTLSGCRTTCATTRYAQGACPPMTVAICISFLTRISVVSGPIWTIDSVLESHGPCKSFELSIVLVRHGLNHSQNPTEINTVVGPCTAQTPAKPPTAPGSVERIQFENSCRLPLRLPLRNPLRNPLGNPLGTPLGIPLGVSLGNPLGNPLGQNWHAGLAIGGRSERRFAIPVVLGGRSRLCRVSSTAMDRTHSCGPKVPIQRGPLLERAASRAAKPNENPSRNGSVVRFAGGCPTARTRPHVRPAARRRCAPPRSRGPESTEFSSVASLGRIPRPSRADVRSDSDFGGCCGIARTARVGSTHRWASSDASQPLPKSNGTLNAASLKSPATHSAACGPIRTLEGVVGSRGPHE